MCAHGNENPDCPLCEPAPVFSRNQIAFLEDLLINRGYMQALAKGVKSPHSDKCRECAIHIEDLVDIIRGMSAGVEGKI